MNEKKYIYHFSEITNKDVAIVGGKNASLGEMFQNLQSKGVKVPDGFATSSTAFRDFLEENNITTQLQDLMVMLNREDYSNLIALGAKARSLILKANFSNEFKSAILLAYQNLSKNNYSTVAVRSSATLEDLPQASFAGQHESFLNVAGDDHVLNAVKNCFASLYTNRAIKYREDHGFPHDKVSISVGIQLMVRSDMACSGVAFTIEPESGFSDIIQISGVWGLGENMVQGVVMPDEFYVFKPTLLLNKQAIVQRKLGEKSMTMVYDASGSADTVNLPTSNDKKNKFVLIDDEINQLAKWCIEIEKHYNKPMDIEWAKDGISNQLYILQARPETFHSKSSHLKFIEYSLTEKSDAIITGSGIGSKIVHGIVRKINSPNDPFILKVNDIVVTDITSPDWDPILKKSSGIITNKGGRTSHASIVARELGVPAVVGTGDGTEVLNEGDCITISCAEGKIGKVYKGHLSFQKKELDFSSNKKPQLTEVMLIVGDPEKAFVQSFYPNDGVGLMRIEFIITHLIQVHPMALVNYEKLSDVSVKNKIDLLTAHFEDKKKYFVDKLSESIAVIAAAFYPKDVIVRMSDLKTNEYANLLGGAQFEPKEENPMIGFRGASRYYNDLYKEGFKLECEAIKRVRDDMGLFNVKVMIPFCRTIDEGKKVLKVMKDFGLDREKDESLEIYVMAEIPSNVILADEFAEIFDGFSIGSNDLTQLTLGIDRDSAIVSHLFDENNEAPKEMIRSIITKAKRAGVKIGICGQAASDFPDFTQFLVKCGIDSISFNPDALMNGMENIRKAEASLKQISVY